MKRLFLLFLPFALFADDLPSTGNSDVDQLFNSLSGNLNDIVLDVTDLLYDVERYYQQGVDLVDSYQTQAQYYPDNQYYQGLAAGGRGVQQYMDSLMTSTRYNSQYVVEDVTDAQTRLVTLATSWNMDRDAICRAISNNTFVLSHWVSNNTDVVSLTVQTNAATCVSNIQLIVRLLRAVFPSGDTNVNQQVSNNLDSLAASIDKVVIDFGKFWTKADNLLDWMLDEQENYQKFFKIASERLEMPDANCQQALQDMWIDVIRHRQQVFEYWNTNTHSYLLSDQIANVTEQFGHDLRLSNEGLIALENLAVNQRSYLCLAEMLPKIGSVSNNADVGWITNYLARIQKPYYELFIKELLPNSTTRLFNSQVYGSFTNLVEATSGGYTPRTMSNAYNNFREKQTNYWERIESYLLHIAGLSGGPGDLIDSDIQDEYDRVQDKEHVERDVEYSTNAVISARHEIASVSNDLNRVVAKFKEFLDAFKLEDSGWDGVIRLTPQYELGGIAIEPFYVDETHFGTFVQGTKKVFKFIWYAIFIFIGFRLTLYVFMLFGRTVAHIALIVSTLLS